MDTSTHTGPEVPTNNIPANSYGRQTWSRMEKLGVSSVRQECDGTTTQVFFLSGLSLRTRQEAPSAGGRFTLVLCEGEEPTPNQPDTLETGLNLMMDISLKGGAEP